MKKILLTAISLAAINPCYAGIIPVFDGFAIGRLVQQIKEMQKQYEVASSTYNNAKQQYTTLQNTYKNAQNQLSNLQSLKDFNSGKYGWGSLKNTAKDLNDMQWSADSWNSTLKNVAGGNSARYKQLLDAYKKEHPGIKDSDFEKSASKNKLLSYRETILTTSNADTQATTAYNNVNNHHKTIHELAKSIESEKNTNTKSSIDLNSRLVAENAQVQTEMLKQLSILNKQAALRSANELRELEEAAKFNKLPDN